MKIYCLLPNFVPKQDDNVQEIELLHVNTKLYNSMNMPLNLDTVSACSMLSV